jgi:hypothetical protein
VINNQRCGNVATLIATKLPQTAKTTQKHAKTDFLTVKHINHVKEI